MNENEKEPLQIYSTKASIKDSLHIIDDTKKRDEKSVNWNEIVPFKEGADIYVINTCTVTNMADRKSRQMLHRAKKKNPNSIIVAVGCYVQAAKEQLEKERLLQEQREELGKWK